MAKSNKTFDYIRNTSALLSLGNILAAYWQLAAGGQRSAHDFLQQEEVRLRLWISCVVLGAFGLTTLALFIKQRTDIFADYQEGSGKQQVVALSFGVGLIVLALTLYVVLTVSRP